MDNNLLAIAISGIIGILVNAYLFREFHKRLRQAEQEKDGIK